MKNKPTSSQTESQDPHTCAIIHAFMVFAHTHNAIAPVISPADNSPTFCNPNKLTPLRGKYQHLAVFSAETEALTIIMACKQLLTVGRTALRPYHTPQLLISYPQTLR